jgi:hypothetical protein
MTNNSYIPPDYSEAIKAEQEHPQDDDPIEDVLEEMLTDEEDDIKAERFLDEQAAFNDNLQESNNTNNNFNMSNSFGSTPPWSSGSGNNTNSTPWSNNNTSSTPWQNNSNSWKPSGNSWGTWGSNNSTWNSSNNNQINQAADETSKKVGHRDVVIIDALDGLVESYMSDGKPNVVPRAIYDMKFKFDIWDRVAALSPRVVCIILPAEKSVPSLGNSASASAAMEYLASSLSVYLKIPRENCIVFRQMNQTQLKDNVIKAAINTTRVRKRNQIIYLGVYCGDWGLSTADLDAANRCKVDCISIYKLLGKI